MAYVQTTRSLGPNHNVGQCDVCTRVDHDYRLKIVSYCSFCKAYICDACKRSPVRRALAAALKAIGR